MGVVNAAEAHGVAGARSGSGAEYYEWGTSAGEDSEVLSAWVSAAGFNKDDVVYVVG